MTDLFRDIYSRKAEQYDRMVSFEDYQDNIPKALREIRPFLGLEVVDLGAGTGRLTAMIAPEARNVSAFDISDHMLSIARRNMAATGLENWKIEVADNRSLPVRDQIADLAISGWSLGHAIGWYPDNWKAEIQEALDEMDRITRANGTLVILETLGTGHTSPQPPTEGHQAFYRWLENTHGFHHRWIRTDYRFESAGQAAELTRFFFGYELAERILAENSPILPECTGIWWLHKG